MRGAARRLGKEVARMDMNGLLHRKLGTCARKCKGKSKGKFKRCVKKCMRGGRRRRRRC